LEFCHRGVTNTNAHSNTDTDTNTNTNTDAVNITDSEPDAPSVV